MRELVREQEGLYSDKIHGEHDIQTWSGNKRDKVPPHQHQDGQYKHKRPGSDE
jgi:hypothetical protein